MQTKQLDSTEMRRFAFILGLLVVLVFGMALPWFLDENRPYWPFALAAVAWTVSIVFPRGIVPVYRCWMKVGAILASVNSIILLSVIYFLMIFPLGMLFRLLGKDPMNRKIDKHASSYRVLASEIPPSSMDKPF